MPEPILLDTLLAMLRLTTVMRSVDASHVVPCLFQHENNFFVRYTDKNATSVTASVGPKVVGAMMEYLARVCNHPAPFLFRYEKAPEKCLTSERQNE